MQSRSLRIAIASFGAAAALALAGSAQAADRPDAWVTTKVKMALLTSEGVSARDVNVDTVDGRVTLHGMVATQAEKAKAEQVASQVEGAAKVRNLLQVVAPKQEAAVSATDDQISERVTAKLKADRALADSSITVQSVNSGVVLLAGKAATLSDSARALDETAKRYPYVPLADQLKDHERRLRIIKKAFKFDLSVVPRLTWLLRRLNIQVVQSFLFDAEIAVRLAGRAANTPLVVGSERNTAYRPAVRRCESVPRLPTAGQECWDLH
jgi:osmotically-inducible protein OsmY